MDPGLQRKSGGRYQCHLLLRAVILDIDQRICSTAVQACANVTLEECEDTLHQMVEKAQQLFAYLVSDETVPNKTDVCNFLFKADANETDIVGHLCDKIGTFL